MYKALLRINHVVYGKRTKCWEIKDSIALTGAYKSIKTYFKQLTSSYI
jgi:hypothetical protein